MTDDHQSRNMVKRQARQLAEIKKILAMPPDTALREILNSNQPATLVQSLSPEDFYFLIHDIGIDDALPLVELAASSQWEYVLDLETWRRDHIDLPVLSSWLQILFQADRNRLVRWLLAEKTELFEYYLFRYIDVKIRQHDQDPSDFRTHYFTLDDIFYIRFLRDTSADGDSDEEEDCFEKTLLEHMALMDYTTYQNVLLEVMSVIPAEVEEEDYRLRNVRLAEKGFVPFEEAMEVYAPMGMDRMALYRRKSPASSKKNGASESLPPVAISLHTEHAFFTDALRVIESEGGVNDLQLEFAALLNSLISADQKPVREREALNGVIKKAVGYLSIGLELITGEAHDAVKAAHGLRTYRLAHIFRLGYTQAMELKFRSDKWVKESWFKSKGLPLSFWDEDFMGVIGGLLVHRPYYFDNYETGILYREFETLADIHETRQQLEDIIDLDNLMSLMPVNPAQFPDPQITYIRLILTAWACHLIEKDSVRPLTPTELRRFFERLWQGEDMRLEREGKIDPAMKTAFLNWLADQSGLTAFEISRRMQARLETLFSDIEAEYGHVAIGNIDPRFIRHIYVDA